MEGGEPVETDHSDKAAWVEEHRRREHIQTGTSVREERRAGREEKGLSGSSDGEEEEEEGEEGDISQGMEEVPGFEDCAQDFDNPFINYTTPMDHIMNTPGFHDNMQAAPDNSTDSEAKQVESGSEEGEIADDGQNEQEENVEEVHGLVSDLCAVLVY